MKRALALSIALSSTIAFASDAELANLKKEVDSLKQQLSEIKKNTSGNGLKFGVDYRVSVDSIEYEHADGSKTENDSLLTNRLWIDMKYAPRDDLSFIGQISYNKAFGDSANHSQANQNPGYADFDWVTNENANDNTLKVKQAYFIYSSPSFLNSDVSWTASVGRRPSTEGMLANHRSDNDHGQSPLAHSIDVEFDGASFNFGFDKVTGIEGSSVKLCMGRGLTNAKPRFDMQGNDYSEDTNLNENIDMFGFIITPYDDKQYKAKVQVFKAWNLIGFDESQFMGAMQNNAQFAGMMGQMMQDPQMQAMMADRRNLPMLMSQMFSNPQAVPVVQGAMRDPNVGAAMSNMNFQNVGDIYGATVSFEAVGIGEFINDFLDNTTLFASYAYSQTDPQDGYAMLGSVEKEDGYSYWLGAKFPIMITEKGKIGLEYNHGSKYWRSFTYGEDTMVGSKLAARGDAYEVYYNQPILGDVLSMQLRYTYIEYDYTGSNSFFAFDGAPMKIADALALGMNPVENAQDIRLYFRYKY